MTLLSQFARESAQLSKLKMVKSENFLGDLWWNFVPGPVVTVKWPRGWTRVDEQGHSCESADPNDHWRSWLEKNVGRQNWDWGWRVNIGHNAVDIKFRRAHSSKLTAFLLRYA